jgi:MFS family permease
MIGFTYLAGIVLGCLTVARLGDIWGRKPVYIIGMICNLFLTLGLIFSYNKWLDFFLLGLCGVTTTMRSYVGYAYNIEMQPKSH